MFRDGGADLGGVAVGSLAAADDQVRTAQQPDALGEGIGGCQHIRPGEFAVGEDHSIVRAHHVGVPDHGLRLLGAHGQHGHGAAQLLPDTQSALQGKQVKGIGAGGSSHPLEISGLLVDLHLGAEGDLFHTHDDLHCIIPFRAARGAQFNTLKQFVLHFKGV